MIPFTKPTLTGREDAYISAALHSGHLASDGSFSQQCSEKLQVICQCSVMLTTSCTHSLEMAALLCNICQDDEIIMPSFTFPSTANAFVLRGAKIVFVDIEPDTMNIDTSLIEAAITKKTRAIAPMHYGGVACDMNKIMFLAEKHNLAVVEDAAMGLSAKYQDKPLGSIGDYGCLSFHATKNFTMGEGGALLLRDTAQINRAEIIRQKGADIDSYHRGETDHYCWQMIGSSYAPSELNAACLLPQLEQINDINRQRMASWCYYTQALAQLANNGYIHIPNPPTYARHNAHTFFIKVRDLQQREALTTYLRKRDIYAAAHFQPLHSSPAGKKYGHFHGTDRFTTGESQRILRLPLYYGLTEAESAKVVNSIIAFYTGR